MSWEFPEHISERQRRVYRSNNFPLVRDARRKWPVARATPQGIADAQARFRRGLLKLALMALASVAIAGTWWLYAIFR